MEESLKKIFDDTKIIAAIGLSPNENKPSHKVAKFMLAHGFKIIPVYPKEDFILGQKVYRSLDEIKERVDMVNVFRKAEFAFEILGQIKKRDDVKTLWLQLGIINDKAMEIAQNLGLHAIQDRCLMIEYKKLKLEREAFQRS
ncbi:MAG: CoA-binding protein [Campylobacteraceae bacterium]|jgi:predicted CoA-binding protein|nr:CoA-binding protein [Campylobacteraceae bacterium]